MKIILSIIITVLLSSCSIGYYNPPATIEYPTETTDPFILGGKVKKPGGCIDGVDC